ncbi:cadherin domain-containing protein [Geminocystis sp. CENA526]|uniref:cadherin domain-containing protein n=1 Tax=Geminocystis sp. CENA526 TaxID=1355871 RepID=UPI003D6E143B
MSIESLTPLLNDLLADFASQSDFSALMTEIYGNTADFTTLQQQWLTGNWALPNVEIVSSATLNGAYGAYASQTSTIYLSQDLFNSNNTDFLIRVLLEEYGHYVDDLLTPFDSEGDEGELFAYRVLDIPLTEEDIAFIQSKDDFGQITIDGNIIDVQFAVTSASITAISEDTGTPGDFFTTDQTLILSGLYSSDTGAANLFLFLTPNKGSTILVGQISGTNANATNKSWTYDYTSKTLDVGSYTFSLGTTNSTSQTFLSSKVVVIEAPSNQAPTITSGDSVSFAENGTGIVYTATATDPENDPLTFSILGTDASFFDINSSTGNLTFKNPPDFENPQDNSTNNQYDIIVQVTDGTNPVTKNVTITVTNVDEVAPTITSGGTATAIDENSGANQVVYTVLANDAPSISNPQDGPSAPITYSLKAENDFASFTIDSVSGAVTLTSDPDFETKSSYSFTVVATDAVGNFSEQVVSLAINDVLENPISNVPTGGNDSLVGSNGVSNTISAGGGNDIIQGGNLGDTLNGGSGNDVLYGNDGNDRLDGGSGNDSLFGGNGNDILLGGSGSDTLVGGMGNDTLTGGSGRDYFLFNSTAEGVDRITDFNPVDDFIVINESFGGGLMTGTLQPQQLRIGASANSLDQRLIYNRSTGALFFDIDGQGGSSQVQIATLNSGLTLTEANFLVEPSPVMF